MAYNDFVTNILNTDRDAIDLGHILNDAPNKQIPTRLGRLVWTIATINERVDYVTNVANQKLVDLDNAINTAAAAGAGAKGWTADLVVDKSGATQQQVNYNGGSKWHSRVGGYKLNERVVLANGDIVRNTVANNTKNPNVDMTGWVNTNDASQIFDASGASQQSINDSVRVVTNYAYTDYTPLSKILGSKADDQEVAAVLTSAVANQTNVLIDLNCTISTKVIIDKAVSFLGVKGKWITQNTSIGFEVTALASSLDKLNIDTNGNTYGIFEHGMDNQLTNIKFKGNTGHYILSGGVRPYVFNCSHEKGYSQITPFVFTGAKDFEITKCLLDEYTGFGIQARWCKGGKMHDNISNALFSTVQATTTASQTYTLNLGKVHNRFGVTITNVDGKEVPVPFNISSPTGTTYTVTLDAAPTTGRTLKLYGTDALESYQVNSGCTGVKVFDNTSNGTGDSNIVVGCDYRWNGSDWVLDPNNVTPSDEPTMTIIDNNTCNDALYANIAINHSQQHVQITNNTLSRAALCYDRNGAFNTNILCNADGFVDGNSFGRNAGTVLNNITCLRSGSVSNKVGRAGLVIGNKNNFSTTSDATSFTPIFTGVNTEAVVRRQGAIIEGEYSHVGDEIQKTFEAAFVGDMPVATDNFTFSNANGFLNKDTVNTVGGKNSVFINAGVIIDISAKQGMLNRLSNKIVRVRMFVSGNGSINFFPLFSGASTADIKINVVNEPVFVQREIYFPTAQLSNFLIRLSTNNTLYIQDIEIDYLSL